MLEGIKKQQSFLSPLYQLMQRCSRIWYFKTNNENYIESFIEKPAKELMD
jgi:hypothetical protein